MASNPPVPEELLENEDLLTADTIGETAYSKRGCFKTLNHLMEETRNQSKVDKDSVVDISDELQDELCCLWDMAVNPEVSEFLHEFKAADILAVALQESRAPRLTEICLGILDNMMCNSLLSSEIGQKADVRLQVTSLFIESSDSPSLIAAARLLTKFFESYTILNEWLPLLLTEAAGDELRTKTAFVLSSSTNSELLGSVASMLYSVLNCDMCRVYERWLNPDLFTALNEALAEVKELAPTERLIMCAAKFPEQLIEDKGGESMISECKQYLCRVCSDDTVETCGREVALVSALYLYRTLRTDSLLTELEFSEWTGRLLSTAYNRLSVFLHALESEDSLAILRPRSSSHQDSDKLDSKAGSNGNHVNGTPPSQEKDVCRSDDEVTYKHISSLVKWTSKYACEVLHKFESLSIDSQPDHSNERGDLCGACHRLLILLNSLADESTIPFLIDSLCSEHNSYSTCLDSLLCLSSKLKLNAFSRYLLVHEQESNSSDSDSASS